MKEVYKNKPFTACNSGQILKRVQHDKRKVAFTLAETLIAIAIIGIVAALVIPPCIQSYKKTIYSARLKRFYSAMNQAITLYNVENSTECKYWNFPRTARSETAAESFFDTYFAKYFNNVTKAAKGSVRFKDGSTLYITVWADTVDFQYDVNGPKGPNSTGKDAYYFSIDTKNQNTATYGKFTPYIWNIGNASNRTNVLNKCMNNHNYCSQLLYLDNWEYKSDYPLKL